MRIVAEMVMCATDMRRGVQRTVDAIGERRSKSRSIHAVISMVLRVFNCRSTITIFAWIPQMARQMAQHDGGFEARNTLSSRALYGD
jgi:hypothetical protein